MTGKVKNVNQKNVLHPATPARVTMALQSINDAADADRVAMEAADTAVVIAVRGIQAAQDAWHAAQATVRLLKDAANARATAATAKARVSAWVTIVENKETT